MVALAPIVAHAFVAINDQRVHAQLRQPRCNRQALPGRRRRPGPSGHGRHRLLKPCACPASSPPENPSNRTGQLGRFSPVASSCPCQFLKRGQQRPGAPRAGVRFHLGPSGRSRARVPHWFRSERKPQRTCGLPGPPFPVVERCGPVPSPADWRQSLFRLQISIAYGAMSVEGFQVPGQGQNIAPVAVWRKHVLQRAAAAAPDRALSQTPPATERRYPECLSDQRSFAILPMKPV